MATSSKKKLPPEPLTNDEVYRLINACGSGHTGVRNRAMLILWWRAGPRCAELLSLQLRDIDHGKGGMDIRIRRGKGGKARVVGIDVDAAAYVAAWIEVWKKHYPGAKALFCTVKKSSAGPPGQKMTTSGVRKFFARMRAKLKIDKRLHAHGLRHTFALDLDNEGHPLRVVQGSLGHSNAATTSTYLQSLGGGEVVGALKKRKMPKNPGEP